MRSGMNYKTLEYDEFIKTKLWREVDAGFDAEEKEIIGGLFDFQRLLVRWALKRGRAAIFADTGLGKTRMQLSWLNAVIRHNGGKGLIFAPLAVSYQTVEEGRLIGIDLKYTRTMPTEDGIYVTNYEMADKMDLSRFTALVLDESSIIKHKEAKFRNWLIDNSKSIPYRLSCTATPSPNDHMELGNQAEFLGIMSMAEMLAMFFTHDSGETSKWRLKGHGRGRFWEWLSTWAAVVRNPSDIGFSDEGYKLPGLEIKEHIVETGKILDGSLFQNPAKTLSERNKARKLTMDDRVKQAAAIANQYDEPCIVWCHLNDESKSLTNLIEGAVEIKGSDKPDHKERAMMGFAHGDIKKLVTKPSIAGFGMNWQHCSKMIFVGLNDSYEQLYQAIRRCYRFGQTKSVDVHIISSDLEGATLENIKRKEAQAELMSEEMRVHMKGLTRRNVTQLIRDKAEYLPDVRFRMPEWIIGDSDVRS